MKRPRQTLRRYSLALAILFCLVFLLTAPYLVGGRHSGVAWKGAAVFAASPNIYSLSTPVRLLKAPMIELESGTLSVPAGRTGLARGGEVIAMLITGSSARMTLAKATFTVDFTTAEASVSQGEALAGVAPLVSALRNLQFTALGVRDSAVRIKLSDGSILTLDELSADVAAKPDGVVRAVGSFVFRGEKVAFDTTVGTRLDPQSGAHPITAVLDGPLLWASFDGQLTMGESPRLIAPQAELRIANVRRAAGWLGAGWRPGAGFEHFLAKGQLEWLNHTVAFQNATVQMDGNEATGTLSMNFSGARPAVDGTLGLKTLDLTRYLGQGGAAAGAPQASLLSLVSAARALKFPLIETVDADLRISSDKVLVPGGAIGRSAATISLKGGRMIADLAEVEIDEGTRGGGQLRIDTSGPRPTYDVRGKLEALDLGRAAQAVFGHLLVQGRGDVTVEITAAGDSGEDLLGSLNGKLGVTLTEGGNLCLDFDRLAAAALSPPAAGVWSAVSSAAVPIDTLDARFAVSRGVLRTEGAAAQAGARAVSASGLIDLAGRRLDLKLAIGEGGDAADGARPVVRAVVDLSGPWAEPALRTGALPARFPTPKPPPAPDPG